MGEYRATATPGPSRVTRPVGPVPRTQPIPRWRATTPDRIGHAYYSRTLAAECGKANGAERFDYPAKAGRCPTCEARVAKREGRLI